MIRPVRLQLSRRKGFDLQAWSREVNGLPATNVARPSKWGNPYKIGGCLIPDAEAATQAFALNLPIGSEWAKPLKGRNLACWCPLPEPGKTDWCHAAVLLREAALA